MLAIVVVTAVLISPPGLKSPTNAYMLRTRRATRRQAKAGREGGAGRAAPQGHFACLLNCPPACLPASIPRACPSSHRCLFWCHETGPRRPLRLIVSKDQSVSQCLPARTAMRPKAYCLHQRWTLLSPSSIHPQIQIGRVRSRSTLHRHCNGHRQERTIFRKSRIAESTWSHAHTHAERWRWRHTPLGRRQRR